MSFVVYSIVAQVLSFLFSHALRFVAQLPPNRQSILSNGPQPMRETVEQNGVASEPAPA